MSRSTPSKNPHTVDDDLRKLIGRRLTVADVDRIAEHLNADFEAVAAEARQQGRDREPLDVDRLTRAVMAAVGSPHPDDFGIAYRDKRGFSPSGLAAAISEEWARGPRVRGGG